jgi:hypothetical protein
MSGTDGSSLLYTSVGNRAENYPAIGNVLKAEEREDEAFD